MAGASNADSSRTAESAFWAGSDEQALEAGPGPHNDASPEERTEPTSALHGVLLRLGPLPMPSEAERRRRCQNLQKLIAEYETEMGGFTEQERAAAASDLRSIL